MSAAALMLAGLLVRNPERVPEPPAMGFARRSLATPDARLAQTGPGWRKHDINPTAPFEAAGVADFDGDGKLDIFSGDSFYQAPRWRRHKVREVGRKHPLYLEDFADLPLDVNGDGHIDLVTCTFFTTRVGWIEHPGDPRRPW